ncbi:tyrosine-type recombinase/integrase [Natronococcus wangiae]|uniref:tyrosine-type recombinase/integrase n=1 Tax=Natronococcus wangiae TaxID=3068275 RepID=UPI00273D11B8|nr:site-specific integrase [Natronococcus sp. AD5]
MAELEPITPTEAKEMFLAQRRAEVAEATLQGYHYRLKPFVQWCEQEGITNLNDLTARSLHEYRLWRKEDGDLKKITLKGQLSTLRVFVKFLESINGVEQGLHDKILVPTVEDEEAVSNSMLDSDRAEQVLDYLGKYEYASKRHTLVTVLWHTGCRMGAAHSLDVSDFDPEEQALAIRHRPDNGTHLKNKQSGERICALSEDVCDVLEDYIEVTRDDVTDDHGREPLFTTRYGRMHRSKIREMVYAVTRPCAYGEDCPHGRAPDSCEAATYTQASKCPSSVSPHDIRRGSITRLLRNEVPKQVVADRVNSSPETLEKHYSQLTEEEKMEQRRGYLEGL